MIIIVIFNLFSFSPVRNDKKLMLKSCLICKRIKTK